MNLNIRSVNYISNATDVNINQAAQNGQLHINVPSGLTSSEAGLALLKHLSQGDSFTGEIIDITQNKITLALSEQVTITATLSDAVSYNIGDTASFSVKNKFDEQIVLKPVNPEVTQNLMNDKSINNILHKAGVAVNESTVDLVNNLMKHGQSVDSATIRHYVQLMDQFPNATVKDLIYLNKMEIPVTNDNINALHNYNDYSNGLDTQIQDMAGNIQKGINELSTPKQMAEVFDAVISSYSETAVDIAVDKEPMSVLGKSTLKPLYDMLDSFAIDKESSQIVNSLKDNNITAREFISNFSKLLKNDGISKDVVKDLMESKEFKEVVSNFLRQEMYIKPEEINNDNVKKFFAKILSDAENLTEKLSSHPVMNEFVQNNQQVSNSINFMNNINHFMSFVQIPLKMTGQNAKGDLYVYKNGRNLSEPKEELKAFLHLDMEHLGPLDVLVTLKNNKNVTTNFKVATDEILDYIESHINELNSALTKLGYSVNSAVELNNTPYTFNTHIMEQEIPPVEVKRFSFDVRA